MYPSRATFKKEIVSEFMIPARVRKLVRPKTTEMFDDRARVIIFCGGLPATPSRNELLAFFMKKGYWAFMPRFRGTWESDGELFAKSPEQDIVDVIDGLPNGFTDAYTGITYNVIPRKLIVVGSSFGGTAAVLLSQDERVDTVVAFSPVIDWTRESKAEPLDWLYGFIKEGFGRAYKVNKRNWNKLKSGTFYSPLAKIDSVQPEKLFIIAAKDDDVVPYKPTERFAKKTGASIWLLARGGHISASSLFKKRFFNRVYSFIKRT